MVIFGALAGSSRTPQSLLIRLTPLPEKRFCQTYLDTGDAITGIIVLGGGIAHFGDATRSLDSYCERQIQQSIDALHAQMAGDIIACRRSTIKNVKEVLVLHKGQLVEHGRYVDLRERKGWHFAHMVTSQNLGMPRPSIVR